MLLDILLSSGVVVSIYIRVLVWLDLVYFLMIYINLDNLYVETLMTLHHNVGTKRGLVNECSVYLWHKHLGHISKETMARLVKNEILPNLDFTDMNVCVDCIKGKQTKHTKKGATRSS